MSDSAGGGKWLLMGTGFFEGDENNRQSRVLMIAQLCQYTKHENIHFQWVHFVLCKYLNKAVREGGW